MLVAYVKHIFPLPTRTNFLPETSRTPDMPRTEIPPPQIMHNIFLPAAPIVETGKKYSIYFSTTHLVQIHVMSYVYSNITKLNLVIPVKTLQPRSSSAVFNFNMYHPIFNLISSLASRSGSHCHRIVAVPAYMCQEFRRNASPVFLRKTIAWPPISNVPFEIFCFFLIS